MWKLVILFGCVLSVHLVNGMDAVNHFQFASDFIPHIAEKYSEKNVVISPISLQSILTLAAMGSEGETLDELQKVARLESYASKDALRAEYKELINSLESVKPQRVHIANRIYVGKQYSIKPTFQELAANYFASGAESVDFSANEEATAKINTWVSEQTNNKITKLLDPTSVDGSTVAVLVNAVYFKSPWQKQFIQRSTVEQDFYLTATKRTKVEMMHHDGMRIMYCESKDLNVRAVQLPFKNSNLKMVILVPNEKDGLRELQSQMTLENIQKLNGTCKQEFVAIQLPKFKVEFGTSFKAILQKMGMNKAFSNVDFSEMLEPGHPPLYISDVIHKAFISVDEAGAEAGASTAAPVFARMGRLYAPNELVVDHPFAYSIQDDNVVYFMGSVVHPTF